jgi:flagellum-specific peptidoglycan hydrolase FlgJ
MTAVINTSIAALPAKSRRSSTAQLNDARTQGLASTMTKWSKAGALSAADFAAAFFERDGGDQAVKLLRKAAEAAARAKSREDLRNASTLLATAEQKIGLRNWPGFVDDAVKRAAPFGEFAHAVGKTATDAGVARGEANIASAKKGTTGKPAIAKVGTPAVATDGARPNFARFFDRRYQPLRDLAKELDVPVDYLLAHAAHESGYLDDHNSALNNPFGCTNAGGRNLLFPSIAEAIESYRRDYGPQIKGAASPKDFAEGLEGVLNGTPVPGWRRYNTRDQIKYEQKVMGLIQSVSRHMAEWLGQRGTGR